MNAISLEELLVATGGKPSRELNVHASITDVVIDSRQAAPGSLFWALSGTRRDGHEFIADAVRRGAIACVVNRDWQEECGPLVRVNETQRALAQLSRWYRNQFEPLVIGVTGSVGKTTTREMIHAVLSVEHEGIRSRENYNNEIGLPLSLLQLEQHHDFGVLEMGACRPGDIRELCDIARPEVGVITGIAPAHLEKFGTLEDIIRTKGELLHALPSRGFAVVNGDCPHARHVADHASCPVIFAGESEACHVRATAVHVEEDYLSFVVDDYRYEVQATGRHHLTSALIAVAIGREVGMSADHIAEGLLQFAAPQGRCQIRRIGPWTVIDDSYNANPASMRAACDLMSNWQTGHKKIAVVGDMLELGDESAQYHRELGCQIAAADFDCLSTFGEHAGDVIRGAESAGMLPHRLAHCSNFDVLLANLDCWIEPGDVLLVKGSRSMRMERVIDWMRMEAERVEDFELVRIPA